MDAGDRSALFATLADAACTDPAVEFVVAFGSHVTGEATQSSDLDLAVKFVDGLSESGRFEKRCFLSGDLQQENAPFIDVADVESLPIDVAHDAVDGRFVCGDEHAFERFRTDVEARFTEQRDTLRHHQRTVIDRIAEDGLRG
jgi:predicted nucleotidyltransferase